VTSTASAWYEHNSGTIFSPAVNGLIAFGSAGKIAGIRGGYPGRSKTSIRMEFGVSCLPCQRITALTGGPCSESPHACPELTLFLHSSSAGSSSRSFISASKSPSLAALNAASAVACTSLVAVGKAPRVVGRAEYHSSASSVAADASRGCLRHALEV
jgi:hypothetical protein